MEIAAHQPALRPYLECACNGLMACSTCHVIVEPEFFARMQGTHWHHHFVSFATHGLPQPVGLTRSADYAVPQDSEMDMLDLAYGLTETSRLGCQIKLRPELDGMTLTIPDGVNNVFS
jgi:ferredoxin